MKKLLAVTALFIAAWIGPAQAVPQTVDYVYRVTFADLSVVPAIGLPTGSLFTARAMFDTSQVVGNTVVIPSDGSAGMFSLLFGSNYNFTHADDLFGGPEIELPSSPGMFPELLFETTLRILSGPGFGDYLLSFSGTDFRLTPALDSGDFRMTGVAAVPEPSTYVLMIAGFGVIGLMIRRRQNGQAA